MSFISTLKDIYHEKTNFKFLYNMKRWAFLSGFMILVSLISLFTKGLTLGIDFTGGSAFTIPSPTSTIESSNTTTTIKSIKSTTPTTHVKSSGSKPHQLTSDEVRQILDKENIEVARIQTVNQTSLRVQTEALKANERNKLIDIFANKTSQDSSRISVDQVGPTWGQTVSKDALKALIVFFIIVALYLSIRFEGAMAISAIITVIHDIILVAGVYSITQVEVTPSTVVALLTILGFSLYDTVVVFDQIRVGGDSLKRIKDTSYTYMANKSLNSVLMRSINTSIVALLPVLSLVFVGSYLLGATALLDFAIALLAGLATGAYSSIFISAPVAVMLKRKQAWVSKLESKYYDRDLKRLDSKSKNSFEFSDDMQTPTTVENDEFVIQPRGKKK